jgi:ribosomal 50S subunit-recycling heat shock protein
MRLDKYLKVSRLIKRRTVANDACDAGRVMINDKVAKASADVKAGDITFTPDNHGHALASKSNRCEGYCKKRRS